MQRLIHFTVNRHISETVQDIGIGWMANSMPVQ